MKIQMEAKDSFKAWLKRKAAKVQEPINIENIVEDLMHENNLRIEYEPFKD